MKSLAACLLLSLSLFATNASAATIDVFGQNGGANTITGIEAGGVTHITGTNVAVIMTTLNELGVNQAATFNLSATSTAAAQNVGGNLWTQTYSGNFSILGAGGFNYLSGVFTGVSLGVQNGSTLILGSTQPPQSLVFTSDVVGMPLGDPAAMALAFTNLNTPFSITDGSFGSFTSNVGGTFSANPVPEPATMILLGSGLLGIFKMRKRKTIN